MYMNSGKKCNIISKVDIVVIKQQMTIDTKKQCNK